MTLSVPPKSPLPADAGRREDQLADEFLVEPAGVGSWRVCDSRVARGEGRFVAFIDEKNDEFEVLEIDDDFAQTAFPTMREALVHVTETSGLSRVAEHEARTQ